MGCSVKCAANFAIVLLVLSLGAHIAGLLTDYWCVGSQGTTGNNETIISSVHMGLFKEAVKYSNGTDVTSDSSLNLKEEQYLMVSIAGINAIFCLILCIKAIHILVGVSAFIIMTLLLISTFYCFEHTHANMNKLQAFYPTWPELSLSWSFFLVFFGLILNIIATFIFLSMLLYKGERKAANLSKSLGPKHTKHSTQEVMTSEKTVYENSAYTTETSGKLDISTAGPSSERINGGHPVTYSVQIDDIQMDEPDIDTGLKETESYGGSVHGDSADIIVESSRL